jgi:23S rRNA (cytosine1962-C5)-methyltransferase
MPGHLFRARRGTLMGGTPAKSAAKLRLRISPAAERHVRSGHPWIFAESIQDQNRPGITGELAVIYDRRDRFMAIGLFDELSPIRVRVLHSGEPRAINPAWWQERLEGALAKRQGLFAHDTNGYRIINGESDGWPGLVLDRYSTCLVLKVYTAAWLPRLDEIVGLITTVCHPGQLVLRLSRNIQPEAARRHLADGQFLQGQVPGDTVIFTETGLRFEAEVVRGQKTGFYLDQRENRRIVEKLSAGKDVLNAFSFSGGFSLYAARGGARSVMDIDISQHALESSKRNHNLNLDHPQVRQSRRQWVQADVFSWLEHNHSRRKFDLVITDPPSMARREVERAGAINAYRRLASLGARCLNPNGVLLCCSCSAHVTADEFFNAALAGACSEASFRELQRTGHAPDHAATFPEGHYLKAIYLKAQ